MIKYEVIFDEGNYLWDRTNKNLIRYYQSGSYVIGYINTPQGCNVATPIPLNEDILEAIGFFPNGKAEYQNGEIIIAIDGTCPVSILVCMETPIRYVSDLQNLLTKNGIELSIDEERLRNACLMSIK